jgi:hypothetical protein
MIIVAKLMFFLKLKMKRGEWIQAGRMAGILAHQKIYIHAGTSKISANILLLN